MSKKSQRRLSLSRTAILVYDDFDRSDRLLQADESPSEEKQRWAVFGPGTATAAIKGRKLTVTDNTYCYLDNGKPISVISGTFSMVPSGTGLENSSTSMMTLIADQALGGLQTMLHLIVSPDKWVLQKRILGGDFIAILSGDCFIQTTGTVYSLKMEISGSTATITGPSGEIKSITDTDIGTINPRYGCWQIRPLSDGYAGRWHSASMSQNVGESVRAEGQGAGAIDASFSRGFGLTRTARRTFQMNSGVGWYRICTEGTYLSAGCVGKISITANDTLRATLWTVNLKSFWNYPIALVQEFAAVYSGGPISKVRMSRDSTTHKLAVDVYVPFTNAVSATFDFTGIFKPLEYAAYNPTPLTTESAEITIAP